ncbi:MAG: hypothetical protein ABIX10_13475 [Acidimicrobiales bacterium]
MSDKSGPSQLAKRQAAFGIIGPAVAVVLVGVIAPRLLWLLVPFAAGMIYVCVAGLRRQSRQ